MASTTGRTSSLTWLRFHLGFHDQSVLKGTPRESHESLAGRYDLHAFNPPERMHEPNILCFVTPRCNCTCGKGTNHMDYVLIMSYALSTMQGIQALTVQLKI
jgi:hypothetical protein